MQKANFIVGTMRWGDLSVGQAAQLLAGAVDAGVTTFDLADIYGGYTIEKLFGQALKASGVARDALHIISKCAIVLPQNGQGKRYDTSRAYIRASVTRSLEQIGTDYLDTLLIHRPSPLMDLQEIAATFDELHANGQVRSFGVSNFDVYGFEQLNTLHPLAAHQIELSLTQPNALFDNTLLQLRLLGKSAQIWSPLGTYFTADAQPIRPILLDLCDKYQATESQLLIAWARHRQPNAAIVLGSTNLERLRMMIEAAKIEMEDADWFALLEAARGFEVV